jgi:hypothetical protein
MSAATDHVIAEHAMLAWCLGMSDSVKHADFERHMSSVSRKVKVYGVPSKEVIDYRDWATRRKFEFKHGEVLSLNYQKSRLISATPRRIRFSTVETTVAKDGKMLLLSKNIILEHEDDGIWRVVEELVTNWKIKNIDLSRY